MRNATQPATEVTIDGETYKLVFNLEAISEAEDVTSMALITGLHKKDIETPRISLIRALLWASMRIHHPDVTLSQARPLVNQWNWSEVWGKVLEAWVAGMKKPEAKESADPQPGQS